MTYDENVARWVRIKEESFKGLGRARYDKGSGFEAQYSIAYDKLALLGARQRLRKRYRVR